MATINPDLKYSKSHEWVRMDGDVESVKAVSDLMSPVTGTVCEINEELLDAAAYEAHCAAEA